MSSEKIKELLIVVIGGPLGIHKFMNRDFKMGIIYFLQLDYLYRVACRHCQGIDKLLTKQ